MNIFRKLASCSGLCGFHYVCVFKFVENGLLLWVVDFLFSCHSEAPGGEGRRDSAEILPCVSPGGMLVCPEEWDVARSKIWRVTSPATLWLAGLWDLQHWCNLGTI